MALLLGGSSSLRAALALTGAAPFTIHVISRRDATPTGIQAILSIGNPATSLGFNALQWYNNGAAPMHSVSFINFAEGDSANVATASYHRLIGVFDTVTTNGQRRYVDGTLTQSNWDDDTGAAITHVDIGRTCSVDITEFLTGAVEHVAIWRSVLTTQQIADLNAGTVNPMDVDPANLLCYLPLTADLVDLVGDLTWVPTNLGSPSYESSGITVPAPPSGGVTGTMGATATPATAAMTGTFEASSKPETVPLTVVAGTVATNSAATTLAVTSPDGAIGDLVIFFLNSNDYSDGTLAPVTPPITLTQIDPGSDTQLGGDFRARIYWGIEDTAAGRAFTFGTLSNAEEVKGVCLRFGGGVVALAPILAGTPGRLTGFSPPAMTGTKPGQWAVAAHISALNPGGATPPSGWTERVDSSTANYTIQIWTKALTDYPLQVELNAPAFASTTVGGQMLGFIIDIAATDYVVAGVTHDDAGNPVGGVQVSLFKNMGSGVYQYVATQVSNASTGAYSFTVYEHPAAFMVVANLAGSPNTFDVTDNNLLPI